jgi:cystathionine beta-lyase/cystathionine gamma-synthase
MVLVQSRYTRLLRSKASTANTTTQGAAILPGAILVSIRSILFVKVSDGFTEHHIAKISTAGHAFAVSSGMAALDVILRLLKPGDEVIAGDDLYGGTNRLLTYLKTHGGVVVHHVDTTNPLNLHKYITAGKTAMVLLESPTNPLLKIADLATIAAQVKQRAPNALVVVDNTMMSPYLQRPLEYGADIVYDSGTKYLSGHHDLMAGVITCNDDNIAKVRPHAILLCMMDLSTYMLVANSIYH